MVSWLARFRGWLNYRKVAAEKPALNEEIKTASNQFQVFPNWLKYRIVQAVRPFIDMKVEVAQQPLPLTGSKLGGLPYLAAGEDCPRDDKGRPFFLLAQLNFAEIAATAGKLRDLPETGLLQIFIPAFDENYGALENRHQVRFFANVPEENAVNKAVLSELSAWYGDIASLRDKDKAARERFADKYGAEIYMPFYVEHTLHFSIRHDFPDWNDEVDFPSFARFFEWKHLTPSQQEQVNSLSRSLMGRQKILGYPSFCQGDPRTDVDRENPPAFITDFSKRLFLQFVSTYSTEKDAQGHTLPLMMWADVGEGQFFITHDDLIRRDFSKMEFWLAGH